jgi:hypothetical protein
MWWFEFTLLISMTLGITGLIVWGHIWIDKHKHTHPDLYKNKWLFRLLVWITLSSGDF